MGQGRFARDFEEAASSLVEQQGCVGSGLGLGLRKGPQTRTGARGQKVADGVHLPGCALGPPFCLP